MPEEANKLLHAWAKQHKEDNDLTNGDMSLMLFKWTTELAFIRAKFLAKRRGASYQTAYLDLLTTARTEAGIEFDF